MSERSEAARIGAKLQKNSGRGKIQKGDMTLEAGNYRFVIDSKEYTKSFGISQTTWGKICTDTMKVDRTATPMLYLILGEGANKVRLAVIEYEVLEDLIDGQNRS